MDRDGPFNFQGKKYSDFVGGKLSERNQKT
jgi:hypothetical protein